MSEYGLQSKKKIHNGGMIATGVLLTVAGALFLLWPGATLVTLTVIAGIAFISTAIVEFIFASEVRGTNLLDSRPFSRPVSEILPPMLLTRDRVLSGEETSPSLPPASPPPLLLPFPPHPQIGRASCRERVSSPV